MGQSLLDPNRNKTLIVSNTAGTTSLGVTGVSLAGSIVATHVALIDSGGTQIGGTAANPMVVGGNVASGATDSGNPVKTGGIYNSAAPTLTTGQRGDTQMDVNANTQVNLATALGVGIDSVAAGAYGHTFTNITTQTTTAIVAGAGVLHTINFNKPLASGTVTIYNNTAGSGTLIGTITFPATLLTDVATYIFNIAFSIGLTIVTAGATQDITVATR